MSERELHVLRHPLIQHKLTLLRQKDRSTNSFRLDPAASSVVSDLSTM